MIYQNEDVRVDFLSRTMIDEIASLGQQINPERSISELGGFLEEMFQMDNYICFGLYHQKQLVGICSAWTTVRFYSGKQLEIDNVIIDESKRSQGLGGKFLRVIEDWARDNDYQTMELNSYVDNAPSHKFYFDKGYKILGFHFLKKLPKD